MFSADPSNGHAFRSSQELYQEANGGCVRDANCCRTLAGIPALKVPDNWPGYDIVAQPVGGAPPIRISVKSRTYMTGANYVGFSVDDTFEWLAIVLLKCDDEQKRRVFLIPADIAHSTARKNRPDTKSANERYWSLVEIPKLFSRFENNYSLLPDGVG